ncbi:MAG: IS3 family transposase, partial [Chlorobiaceae bacterium]
NHADARRGIFKYIVMFYNRKHRHSTLEYLSPVDFLNRYQQSLRMAS